MNGVVPVAVELIATEIDLGYFAIRHFDAGRVNIGV